ncbi:MAG: hypothetical protein Q8O34_00825 [Rhodocyclaceae bacterium]|nr:hypothetical protein [Rhodocyclaceae bacterium]
MPWTTETLLKAVLEAAPEDCITEARMAEISGLAGRQVERAVLKLRRHGFMTRTARGCHKLTEAGRAALAEGLSLSSGPKGPQESGQRRRDPGLRLRVWNVLRMGGKRTVDDILMRVVDGDERDAPSNVRKYLRALARAGYLLAMPARERPLNATSNGCVRWLLVKDTGPEAPVSRVSRGTLYDPNIEAEIPLAPHVEAAP